MRTTKSSRTARTGRTAGAMVALAALALTGCASLQSGPGGSGDGGSGGADDGAAQTEPVLQVVRSGGFVPMGYDFATVPELTVYADGVAVTHGPQVLIYPGPALPNLLTQDLSDDDLAALVDAAREAGLLEGAPEYGQPPVADAPTTYVTLTVDGETYVHEAAALGTGDGTDGGDAAGLTEDERAARIALSEFVAGAHELVGTAGEGDAYDIGAFAVMALPTVEVPAEEGVDAAPDEMERQVLPWPIGLSLAESGECVLVDGDEAATLEETLAGASTATLYEQDGVRYDVFFRVLLPHESGCSDLR